MKLVAEKTDALLTFSQDALSWHRQIIKWLLAVVCIIALGKSALDMGKQALLDALPKISAADNANDNK
jgi:hypothetical protein